MRCLLFVLCLALVVPSCKHKDSATAGLPSDWPVPQLTLGADWDLSRSVVALHKQEHSGIHERTWLVVFRSKSPMSEITNHVEGCLRPMSYWRMRRSDNPSGFTSPDLRTYFSPDYYVEVRLGRRDAIQPAGHLDEGEYALLVTDHDRPPEMLQVVLDLRKTSPDLADKVRDSMLEPF